MLLTLMLTLAAAPEGEREPAPPPRCLGEFLQIETPTGTLKGFLDLPPGPGPWPVVLLHAGSGPTDRDGNGPLTRTDNLRMLGRALAAEGIAVLRIDKRGVAGSLFALSREDELRLDTYAVDVVAWAARLRSDPRFTRVGFIGHSEGALIGLLAARQARFDAFVSLCGPGRPLQDVLREQLRAALPAELHQAAERLIDELAAGRTVKDVPKQLHALFRPSVQPYLISSFRHDPAKLMAELRGPVLVVAGSTDLQVSAEDARRLGQAQPQARVVTIRGMNHVLKAVDTADRLTQLPSYTDPSLPLHSRLIVTVSGFLKPSLTSP